MAAWAWRSWEFIVALVLIELYANSLLMVSAYGLLDNLARVVLGPVVGGYIDRHERLPAARAMLRLQNQCIGGSAAAALALLWPGSPSLNTQAAYWPLMWLLTVLGAASSSGSTGVTITVEREAVKALCGDDARALASLNSVMRAIDLAALLLAPLAAGLLMTAAGPFAAVAGMAGYCMGAYVPEVLLLGAAFKAAPVLGQPKVRQPPVAAVPSPATAPAGQPAGDGDDGETAVDESTALLAPTFGGTEVGTGRAHAGSSGHECHFSAFEQVPISSIASADGPPGRSAPVVATAVPTSPPALRVQWSGLPSREGSASLNQPLLSPRSDSVAGSSPTRGSDLAVGSKRGADHSGSAFGREIYGACSGGGGGGETEWESLPSPTASARGSASGLGVGGGVSGETEWESLDPSGSGTPVRATNSRALSTASSMSTLPVISSPKQPTAATPGAAAAAAARTPAPAAPAPQPGAWRRLGRSLRQQAVSYGDSWRTYLRQPVLLLCLALALLYMTVLSLGFLMTSFLKWSGLTEAEVSGYRGMGALTGLAATAIFPPLSARAGLRFCAVAGVMYQLACLAAGVLPVFVAQQEAEAAGTGGGRPAVAQVRLLVGGLVMSRTGLWLYDLAVTQLIQEGVQPDQMGSVYGVQSSLQACFEMLSFVAGMLSPDPSKFRWLMLGSVGSVAAATSLVWSYACGCGCGGSGEAGKRRGAAQGIEGA